MKRHTHIYMKAFDYCVDDFIPCEVTGARANDINHILNKGSGGDPTGSKDRIENLMAMTRQVHSEWGDDPSRIAEMFKIHKAYLIEHGVEFDEEWIDRQILIYETINDPIYKN